jgi:hypothetical protein
MASKDHQSREIDMSTSDAIAFERRRYLASAHTRLDWFHYIAAVERLRRQPEDPKSTPPLKGGYPA